MIGVNDEKQRGDKQRSMRYSVRVNTVTVTETKVGEVKTVDATATHIVRKRKQI